MASHRNQHRSSRHGRGAGHDASQEYPVSYVQESLDESFDPKSFMGQLGITEEPCVDPQLTLHQAFPGGTGFSQYRVNSDTMAGEVQPAYDASTYTQTSVMAYNYINTPDANMSSYGFGEST